MDNTQKDIETNIQNAAQVICDAATKIAELISTFYNDISDNNFKLLQRLATHNAHPNAHNVKFAEILNQVSTIRNNLEALKQHSDEQDVVLAKVVLTDDIIILKPDTETLNAITNQ